MDTPRRTIVKALTWQLIGLLCMSLIGYAFTGSFEQGSGIALAGMAVGLATYFLHERLWNCIRWGRQQ